MHVPPAARVDVAVHADGSDRETLARHEAYVRELVRLDGLRVGPDVTRPPASATAVVGGMAIYVRLAGIIDLETERGRLKKELEKVRVLLAGTRKKLENESFITRAPAEVVEAERAKIATGEASLERLEHTLASISE
jgi:valyl-tRNA synthetase